MMRIQVVSLIVCVVISTRSFAAPPNLEAIKADVLCNADAMKTRSKIMVDQIFSYGELGPKISQLFG